MRVVQKSLSGPELRGRRRNGVAWTRLTTAKQPSADTAFMSPSSCIWLGQPACSLTHPRLASGCDISDTSSEASCGRPALGGGRGGGDKVEDLAGACIVPCSSAIIWGQETCWCIHCALQHFHHLQQARHIYLDPQCLMHEPHMSTAGPRPAMCNAVSYVCLGTQSIEPDRRGPFYATVVKSMSNWGRSRGFSDTFVLSQGPLVCPRREMSYTSPFSS